MRIHLTCRMSAIKRKCLIVTSRQSAHAHARPRSPLTPPCIRLLKSVDNQQVSISPGRLWQYQRCKVNRDVLTSSSSHRLNLKTFLISWYPKKHNGVASCCPTSSRKYPFVNIALEKHVFLAGRGIFSHKSWHFLLKTADLNHSSPRNTDLSGGGAANRDFGVLGVKANDMD